MSTAKTEKDWRTGPGKMATFESFIPSRDNKQGGATESIEDKYNRWASEHPKAKVISQAPTSCSSTEGLHQTLVVRYYEPPSPTPEDLELKAFVAAQDKLSIKRATREIEELLIRRALAQTKGRREAAALLLEISHRALLYKIKEFGIT